MTVRKAAPEDAKAISAIEKAWATTPGWTEGQVAEELARPDASVLVAEDGALVAYAAFRAVESEARLLTIAVHPEAAGQGLGRTILEAALAEARRLKLSKMTLEVEAGNVPALRLYTGLGFINVGRRPGFYGPGRDAILMDLELP